MNITKAYSEPNQTFKVKPLAKTVNSWKLHFIENSISDVWMDFKLPSASLLRDVKKRVVWRYLRSKRLQVFYEKDYSKHWKGNTYTGVNLSKTCSPTTCIFIKRDFGTIIFLEILQNHLGKLFRRTSPDECFRTSFDLFTWHTGAKV